MRYPGENIGGAEVSMRFIVKAKVAEIPVPVVTEKVTEKRRKDEELKADGLRRLSFVVPIELWEKWLAVNLRDGVKANDLFIAWIRETGGKA